VRSPWARNISTNAADREVAMRRPTNSATTTKQTQRGRHSLMGLPVQTRAVSGVSVQPSVGRSRRFGALSWLARSPMKVGLLGKKMFGVNGNGSATVTA